MKTTLFKMVCLAAVCAWGFTPGSRAENTRIVNAEAGIYAQNDSSRSDRYSTSDTTARTASEYSRDEGMKVPEVNKASGLIGMTVRNHQNQKIGKIKDVVLDLDTGRISYVIVGTGGFAGIKSKRLAAPPDAFEVVEGKHEVILDTTKERAHNAPGLARNDWPAVQNPDWDTRSHWYEGVAVGGAATQAESGKGTSQHRAGHGQETYRGEITAVDPATGMFTVRGDQGTKTFKLGDRPDLVVPSNRNPSLMDFRVGYEVEVGYNEASGQNTAQYLRRMSGPTTRGR